MTEHNGPEREEAAENSKKDQSISGKSDVGISKCLWQEEVHSQDNGLGDPDRDHGTYLASDSSLSNLGLFELPDSHRLNEELGRHYSREEEDPRRYPESL